MSAKSTIEWTERTWNPLTGCTKVSPGCDHCYAKTMHERFHGAGSFDTITLHPDRLKQPSTWRKPAQVFVNSMSDLFQKDVPDEFIARVFVAMSNAPQHTFQLLTKRHGRMRSLLSSERFWLDVAGRAETAGPGAKWTVRDRRLPNVHLGVSVEDQRWADIRIPTLLDTPAAVRWISAEPLLGPVNLIEYVKCGNDGFGHTCLWGGAGCTLDWVVVGGESGPGARPMHPQWARDLRDQCAAAGVPFLFKQHGSWQKIYQHESTVRDVWVDLDGTTTQNVYPSLVSLDAALMRRVGKRKAGRLLDGIEHNGYPGGGS